MRLSLEGVLVALHISLCASSSLLVSNEYGTRAATKNYVWEPLAEPYRVSLVRTSDSGFCANGCEWKVNDVTIAKNVDEVHVVFRKVGEYSVTVVPSDETQQPLVDHALQIALYVKYVRRELRESSDRDREAFFNAMAIMQRIPTLVGRTLYGDAYKSKDWYNRIHIHYGGMRDCDHWHEGVGFVTSHMAFTLDYEQCVQSIFPQATVPFWDFTLESTFYTSSNFRDSPVFASDWMGDVRSKDIIHHVHWAADPDNELHTVIQGRFAYVPVMINADDYAPGVVNSYGMLRAAWNNDPTPFMTRSAHVYGAFNSLKPSGCTEYFDTLQLNSWNDLAWSLNTAAHGHLHELMGGAWFFEYRAANKDGIDSVVHVHEAAAKKLWRIGVVSCPRSCSMETPAAECKCTCPKEFAEGHSPRQLMFEAGALDIMVYYDLENNVIDSFIDEDGNPYEQLPGYSIEQTEQIYLDLFSNLCNTGHIGDMYQATSTNDPTFWVLHPSMDRLWHWKRLARSSSFDHNWNHDDSVCAGHNPTDYQPFRFLFGDQDKEWYYTNEELYELMDPDSKALPYVYDHFNWPHCELLGYDMSQR